MIPRRRPRPHVLLLLLEPLVLLLLVPAEAFVWRPFPPTPSTSRLANSLHHAHATAPTTMTLRPSVDAAAPTMTILRPSATNAPLPPAPLQPPPPPPPRAPTHTLLGLGPDALAEVLGGKGRARMAWRAIREGLDPLETDPAQALYDPRITDKTRSLLQARLQAPHWSVAETTRSPCGTVKLLVRLHDGLLVEGVIIPAASRSTVCVSSQVGCAQACAFCATGAMGFTRHLTPDEILMQLQVAVQVAKVDLLPEIRNVVFMGMGEPMNNAMAVGQALASMTHAHGFALSPNFVTVSTVAPSPQHVHKFLAMPKAKIAWSVHGAEDTLRKMLVPTTSASMAELRQAFMDVMAARGDTDIFIEVTLIDGVNDTLEDAAALVAFLTPFGPDAVKVNLIPYNDTGVNGWKPSSLATILAFQAHVRAHGGWPTFVRTPRGREEASACGQLATEVAARGGRPGKAGL